MRSCLTALPSAAWDPHLKTHVTTPIERVFPGILAGELHDQVIVFVVR